MQPIRHDGYRGDIELFNEEKMQELLDDPEVKEVRVFKMEPGLRIEIGGITYKVTAVRSNGKVTMRPA